MIGKNILVRFEGLDVPRPTEEEVDALRATAIRHIEIEEIEEFFDSTLLQDQDCPPQYNISAKADLIEALYDESSNENDKIISQLEDYSIIVDASQIRASHSAQVSFYVHMVVPGNLKEEYASFQVLIDLDAYRRSIDLTGF